MNRLLTLWKTELGLPAKAATIAVPLLVLALAIGAVWSWRDHRADARFTAAEAKRVKQRTADVAERDAALGRATAAEKREAEARAQAAIYEAAATAAGARATEAAKRLGDEDKRYVEEQRAIGADVDPCERLRRICERIARLYPHSPAAADCGCRR